VQLRASGLTLVCVLGLAGCGTDSPPDSPTLQLPFTSSAASPVLFNGTQGVEVGTTGYFAFGVSNAGNQALTLQDAGYAGDPAMALAVLTEALPATLAFNDEFVVDLTCTPPAQETYAGTVTILSNAVNGPTTVVYLSCTGVP
jgi:hypothetical protein